MTKKQILIIDDEPETVEMLKQFLELFEFEVTGALTGTGGMQLAIKNQPQAIILDLMLPDADGFQICRLMRHHPSLQKTPIVILSARVGKDDEYKGLASGATAYLRKPVDLNKLVEDVRHAIQTGHIPAEGIKQEPPLTEPDAGRPSTFLKGKVKPTPTPVEVKPSLKKKSTTVHIPGLYIPRDVEQAREDEKKKEEKK